MTSLTAVTRAAAKAASARQSLGETIRAAHAAGESLRAIATAASVSHEQVRRILSHHPRTT